MQYLKKPEVIEATQWFENGDHPLDNCETFDAGEGPFLGEGKVVRYYRDPEDSGERVCGDCGHTMHQHGWIDVSDGGLIVCPGDFVVTYAPGRYSVCRAREFTARHEPHPVPYIPLVMMTKEEQAEWEAKVRVEYEKWRDDPNYMHCVTPEGE